MVIQLSSYLPPTGIKDFWISNLLSPSSKRGFEGPFYINQFHDLAVIYVSWIFSFLSLVGFHDSSTSYINRCYFVKYFLQNVLIHPVYLEKTLFEQSLPFQNAIKQDSRINMNNFFWPLGHSSLQFSLFGSL